MYGSYLTNDCAASHGAFRSVLGAFALPFFLPVPPTSKQPLHTMLFSM